MFRMPERDESVTIVMPAKRRRALLGSNPPRNSRPKTHGDAVNAGGSCSSALTVGGTWTRVFAAPHHCRFSYALKTHCRDERGARCWSGPIVAQSTADRDPGLGRKSNMREYRITLYPVRENPCCEKPRYPNPSCTGCEGKAQERRDPSTRTVCAPRVGTVTRLS